MMFIIILATIIFDIYEREMTMIPILKSIAGGVSMGDPKDTNDFKYFTYLEFPEFTYEHQSLMSKLLTKSMFEKLMHKKTASGFTLSNAIQTGVECPSLKIGVAAGDQESYEVFKDLFYKIIKEYHHFDPNVRNHQNEIDPSKLDLSPLQGLDAEKYIVSTRIRAIRNIASHTLPAGTLKKERVEVEKIMSTACKKLSKNFSGSYHSLAKLSDKEKDRLRAAGLLFQEPGAYSLLLQSGSARDWPDGRGVFLNDEKNLMCWVNEEDHCKVIAMQKGADIKAAFESFAGFMSEITKKAHTLKHSFMHTANLGFITSCPYYIGTGLRVRVALKLHNLIKNKNVLTSICNENHLDLMGSHGEDSFVTGSIITVSNRESIGFTETELVQKLINGVAKIIAAESI